MTDGRRIMRPADAAAYLGLSERTLEGYRLNGGGPRFMRYSDRPHSGVGYDVADLDRWIEQRKRASTSEVLP